MVLIYSGGLDSTAALYIYQSQIRIAISFDYGSRHNKEEIKRAKWNCEKLHIKHIIVPIDLSFVKSALLGNGVIPYGHYEDESMKATVVPFRNGIMLAMATAIADSNGIKQVMIGSHSGDHAIYPDCTQDFNSFMSAAMAIGTDTGVALFAPFENWDKKQLANTGISHGMNPEMTYSCYEGGEVQCGKCSTCLERRWALGEITDEEMENERN